MFCTGKYGNYNINTSEISTDTTQNFNFNLGKVFDLPLFALGKTVTATVSWFNLNLEFLSPCFDKSFIAASTCRLNSGKSIIDSNLNTAS